MISRTAVAAALLLAFPFSVAAQPQDHSQHQPAPAGQAPVDPVDEMHAGHAGIDRYVRGPIGGALGIYPMSREASGTAWQPDVSAHSMSHFRQGGMEPDGARVAQRRL